jgi:thiol-disulfide isomerase/thioredoxin
MSSMFRPAGLVLLLLIFGVLKAATAHADERPRLDGRLSQFVYLKPLQGVASTHFRDIDGRTISFDQFRGRAALVNLWATWCAPCVAEMPALDRLQARLGGTRFAVVAIALDTDGLTRVAAFFRQRDLAHLQIYLDPEHRTVRSNGGSEAPLYLAIASDEAVGKPIGGREPAAPQGE